MRHIGGLRRQANLRVGCDLNFARARPQIRDRNAAHLRIVFGRDDHFERRGQSAIAPDKFRAVFKEGNLVGIWFDAARLKAR